MTFETGTQKGKPGSQVKAISQMFSRLLLHRTKHLNSKCDGNLQTSCCSSYLVVNRSVVDVLHRAQTSCLPSSSSGCIHPARFLRRAAQLRFLQLKTCQVKGQSPLHRAQEVQQPERNPLRVEDMKAE